MLEQIEKRFERGHLSFGCAKVAPKVERRIIGGLRPLKSSAKSPGRMLTSWMKRRFSLAVPDANIPAMLTKDVRGG